MQILGYLKKQPKWCVKLDSNGELVSGDNYYGDAQTIKVPIFKARIRYSDHWKGRSAVSINFECANTDDEQGLIDELKGIQPKSFSTTLAEGLRVLDMAMHGKYQIHEDGWFTGTFTFAKKGSTLTLTPFTGKLEDEEILSNS